MKVYFKYTCSTNGYEINQIFIEEDKVCSASKHTKNVINDIYTTYYPRNFLDFLEKRNISKPHGLDLNIIKYDICNKIIPLYLEFKKLYYSKYLDDCEIYKKLDLEFKK